MTLKGKKPKHNKKKVEDEMIEDLPVRLDVYPKEKALGEDDNDGSDEKMYYESPDKRSLKSKKHFQEKYSRSSYSEDSDKNGDRPVIID
jgi:hypothetical protein